MKPWSFVIGIVLIVIGVFALLQVALNALGIMFRIWWIFWPVVLIGVGFWLIMGFSRGGFPRFGTGNAPREETSIPLDGATEAEITVHHGAGRLLVGGGLAAASNLLLAGSFGGGLDARQHRDGDRLFVDMRVRDRDVSHYVFPRSRRWSGMLDWDFTLATTVPLTLNLESGASESRLDLTSLKLRELRVKTGASSTTIDLPSAAGFTRVSVESGAAAVRLRIPAGVSASIQLQSALAGIRVDRSRFPAVGGGFRSTDYEQAANKLDIFVATGVGSVEIG